MQHDLMKNWPTRSRASKSQQTYKIMNDYESRKINAYKESVRRLLYEYSVGRACGDLAMSFYPHICQNLQTQTNPLA